MSGVIVVIRRQKKFFLFPAHPFPAFFLSSEPFFGPVVGLVNVGIDRFAPDLPC